jgi:hypothetical protein
MEEHLSFSMIDDLPDYRALPSFDHIFPLNLKELFVRREINEAPALEVLKEELSTQRLKQDTLETMIESLATNQREIKNTQRGM